MKTRSCRFGIGLIDSVSNIVCIKLIHPWGPFNNYLRGQDEGGAGQKMSAFVHAQGIKIVHTGGRG